MMKIQDLLDARCYETVCHAEGEYACDDYGDGFCEVHVNTLEVFWLLLRSCLRSHRGILQEALPLYLCSCELVHNARARREKLCQHLRISLEKTEGLAVLPDPLRDF